MITVKFQRFTESLIRYTTRCGSGVSEGQIGQMLKPLELWRNTFVYIRHLFRAMCGAYIPSTREGTGSTFYIIIQRRKVVGRYSCGQTISVSRCCAEIQLTCWQLKSPVSSSSFEPVLQSTAWPH